MSASCSKAEADWNAAYASIINTLHTKMREAHLTGRHVAETAEISESYLCEIMSGKKQTSMKLLHRIAHAIGVTITHQVNG